MVLRGLAKTLCFETNMLTIFEMNTCILFQILKRREKFYLVI